MATERSAGRGTRKTVRRGPASGGARERILTAAHRLFASRGYSEVGMSDIAHAAGISRPTVYRYFADKEEILWTIIVSAGNELLELIADVASWSASPIDQLAELIRRHAAIMVRHRVPFRLALRSALELSPARQRQLVSDQHRYSRLVANIVEAGVRQGEFRPVHSAVVGQAILGMTNGLIDWFREDGSVSLEDVGDEFVSVIMAGLEIRNGTNGTSDSA